VRQHISDVAQAAQKAVAAALKGKFDQLNAAAENANDDRCPELEKLWDETQKLSTDQPVVPSIIQMEGDLLLQLAASR
jgi:hypothetical protein